MVKRKNMVYEGSTCTLTHSLANEGGDDSHVQLITGLVAPAPTVLVQVLLVQILQLLVIRERYFRVLREHEPELEGGPGETQGNLL